MIDFVKLYLILDPVGVPIISFKRYYSLISTFFVSIRRLILDLILNYFLVFHLHHYEAGQNGSYVFNMCNIPLYNEPLTFHKITYITLKFMWLHYSTVTYKITSRASEESITSHHSQQSFAKNVIVTIAYLFLTH